MAKEGLIDYRRYQSDKEANNKKTLVLNRAIMEFQEVFWKDVKVGDIIKVGENKWVPADLIVLATSDKDGQGYVSTATLDGEQTLKPKQSILDLQEAYHEGGIKSIVNIKASIECQPPDKSIHHF